MDEQRIVVSDGIVWLTQMNEKYGHNPKSNRHNSEPFTECPVPCLMESSARDQMALQIEMVFAQV